LIKEKEKRCKSSCLPTRHGQGFYSLQYLVNKDFHLKNSFYESAMLNTAFFKPQKPQQRNRASDGHVKPLGLVTSQDSGVYDSGKYNTVSALYCNSSPHIISLIFLHL
jgi:hypothetical protein